MSTDISYAFIDRKCPRCNGKGTLKKSGTLCPRCEGTGAVGELRMVRATELHPTPFFKSLRSTRERERKGVTLRELSRLFGIVPSRLSEIETGRETPTPDEENKIHEWMEKNHARGTFIRNPLATGRT